MTALAKDEFQAELRSAKTELQSAKILRHIPRPSEVDDVDLVADQIARCLVSPNMTHEEVRAMLAHRIRSLTRIKKATEELAANVASETTAMLEIDVFLSEEHRQQWEKLASTAKSLIAEMDMMGLLPEDLPLSIALAPWVRGYNDAVTLFRRAQIDRVDAIERRLAEERLEDEEANAWAARRPPRDPNEETIPFEEVVAELNRREGV